MGRYLSSFPVSLFDHFSRALFSPESEEKSEKTLFLRMRRREEWSSSEQFLLFSVRFSVRFP